MKRCGQALQLGTVAWFVGALTVISGLPAQAASPQVSATAARLHSTRLRSDIPMLKKVAWSPDGRYLAVYGVDTNINDQPDRLEVYDVVSGEVVARLNPSGTYSGRYPVIAFSPDGRHLAAGSAVVRLWNTSDWTVERDFKGPYERGCVAGGTDGLAFSSDGHAIYISYNAVMWPESVLASTRARASQLNDQKGTLRKQLGVENVDTIMGFDARSGLRIFASRAAGQIGGGVLVGGLHYLTNRPNLLTFRSTLSFKPDSSGVPVQEFATIAQFRSADSGEVEREIAVKTESELTASAVSNDSQLFATATDSGPIRVWSAGFGQVVETLKSAPPGARAVSFADDASKLVSCSIDFHENKTVKVWNVSTSTVASTHRTDPDNADFYACEPSPDGSVIARVVGPLIYLFKTN
jgi:WD40 repeat protein